MDNAQRDASSQQTENIVGGECVCAVVDDVLSSCLQDNASSIVAAASPEKISHINGALVTVDSSFGDMPSTDNKNYCENRFPSEHDCLPVTSHSAASCDENVLSETTSSAKCSLGTTWHISQSDDSELDPCAPIVAVGGAKEEELKQGLEQRLGLVLSKLARDSDDDDQRWSKHITSDLVVEDSVLDESVSDVELIDTYDMCHDIRYMLVMDTVREMEDVEQYSYLSFVAYAMYQLFEYSAWNEYVTFHLLTMYLVLLGIYMLLILFISYIFGLVFHLSLELRRHHADLIYCYKMLTIWFYRCTCW